jgi:hypothetical protein
MPILFVDSFDDRTAYSDKYDSATTVTSGAGTTAGRTGNGISCRTSGGAGVFTRLDKTLAAPVGTICAGFAVKDVTTAHWLFRAFDGSTNQIGLYQNANGTVSVVRGDGTVLATTADAITNLAYLYIEVRFVIHNTAGAYEVRMNGVTQVSATGVNTRTSPNNQATKFTIFSAFDGGDGNWGFQSIDDVYIADDAFYGGIKVLVTLPNGDGASTQWARTGGTVAGNYTAVNEASPDDSTSYVSSPNVGDLDLYDFANLPDPSIAVKALQVWTRHERDDVVTRKAKMIVRSAGTNYPQGEFTTAQNVWQDDVQVLPTDPATGVAWTGAGVDAAQFGVQVTV